ncbi:hypothetical protein ACQKO5_05845 [Novosphingobium subterraneum]|uniref:hypothetical protein n=1 Tax=Novosphingobium subterraneum TaxID=48936 RepID=UPI003D09537B
MTLFVVLEARQYQLMRNAQSECQATYSRLTSASATALSDAASAAPRHGTRRCFYHQKEAEQEQVDLAIFFISLAIFLLGISSLFIWIYRGFYPRPS